MLDVAALQNLVSEHENDERYYPVKQLILDIIWEKRFLIDEKGETECLQLLGNSYFESFTPKAEKLYRKCCEVYRKAPFPEVKAILEEVETHFSEKFPQKWAEVFVELQYERIKNIPKSPKADYTYNAHIPSQPFKTCMVDWRTNKPVYLQDGTYVDENGEKIPFIYID